MSNTLQQKLDTGGIGERKLDSGGIGECKLDSCSVNNPALDPIRSECFHAFE